MDTRCHRGDVHRPNGCDPRRDHVPHEALGRRQDASASGDCGLRVQPLAHCNGSPMYTLTRYRSTRDRAVTGHHVTVIDRGLAIVVMAKGTEAMTMALMREIG
jgi:hypothetical protein